MERSRAVRAKNAIKGTAVKYAHPSSPVAARNREFEKKLTSGTIQCIEV